MLIRTLGICFRRVHFHLILARIPGIAFSSQFTIQPYQFFTLYEQASAEVTWSLQASGNNFDFILAVSPETTRASNFHEEKMPGPNFDFCQLWSRKKITPNLHLRSNFERVSLTNIYEALAWGVQTNNNDGDTISHECKCVTSNY